MTNADAPRPALGELARRAQAVIDARAKEQRAEHDDDPDAPYYAYLDGCEAEDAFRAACSPAVILQLVALASGGAEAGDEFHTYTLLLDKYLDSYRGAIEAESDAGLHAPSDPDTDRAYERASIRRAKLDAYVAQRIRALTPERPADASQPGGAS